MADGQTADLNLQTNSMDTGLKSSLGASYETSEIVFYSKK